MNIFSIDHNSTFIVSVGLLILLLILLLLGRRIEFVLKVERLGIPIALLLGLIALFLGPYGPYQPFRLLPQEVTDLWLRLPTPLLTLIFATLLLGAPIPKTNGIIKPIVSQAMLGLFLGFGQYLIGGLVVTFVLIPWLDLDPLMGCLIEVGFEGGHGAAAVMGEVFGNLGFTGGLDFGLAMATVGLLSSTILGSGLVVVARINGWLTTVENNHVDLNKPPDNSRTLVEQIEKLLINLALAGLAVLFGILFLQILRTILIPIGGTIKDVISIFPLFPLALLGSFLIRIIIEKIGFTECVSNILHRELGSLATDLLIATAIASLNIPLLKEAWIPLTILSIAGLTWNLAGMFVFARYIFQDDKFERSISEFGNSTGVAASGLLLLRLSDPLNKTETLPIFSLKQLFLQPLLSGGVITVIAPFVVVKLGLSFWTIICGLMSLIFIMIAIIMDLNVDLQRSD